MKLYSASLPLYSQVANLLNYYRSLYNIGVGKSDSGVKSAKFSKPSNPSAAEADIIRFKWIFLLKNPSNNSSLRLSETRWGSLYMFG